MHLDAPTDVAIVGLVVAWLLYRLERSTTRLREIRASRAALGAVQFGMLGDGKSGETGWGNAYFTKNYDEKTARESGTGTAESVIAGGYQQVFVVPTAPLEALIGSAYATDLSEATIYSANVALWHIGIFNQLVDQQAQLIVNHAAEIADENLEVDRRRVLAQAIGKQAIMLHRSGIGEADLEGGWYRSLKDAIKNDVARLDDVGRWRLYPSGEGQLVLGDAIGIVALAVVVISALS